MLIVWEKPIHDYTWWTQLILELSMIASDIEEGDKDDRSERGKYCMNLPDWVWCTSHQRSYPPDWCSYQLHHLWYLFFSCKPHWSPSVSCWFLPSSPISFLLPTLFLIHRSSISCLHTVKSSLSTSFSHNDMFILTAAPTWIPLPCPAHQSHIILPIWIISTNLSLSIGNITL